MKANELMIWDWVKYYDCNLEKECYARVTSIQADGTEPFVQTSDSDVYYLAEVYKPIQLTPEILEKNRFVWKAGGVVFEGGEDLTLVQCCDEWKLKPNLMSDDTICYIAYVHELQHALRLCGIDELANNFKV